jgi:hypothetical protein
VTTIMYRQLSYIAFAIIVAEITKLRANSTNFLYLVFTECKIENTQVLFLISQICLDFAIS